MLVMGMVLMFAAPLVGQAGTDDNCGKQNGASVDSTPKRKISGKEDADKKTKSNSQDASGTKTEE